MKKQAQNTNSIQHSLQKKLSLLFFQLESNGNSQLDQSDLTTMSYIERILCFVDAVYSYTGLRKKKECCVFGRSFQKMCEPFSVCFTWDSLHAKRNTHHRAWSYKKKKHKKIKAYRKSLQKEPTVNRCLLILDLQPFKL